MSSLRLAMIDKEIITHLELGGLTTDTRGRSLVAKFIQNAIQNTEISSAIQRTGVTAEELCYIYAAMVAHLHDNPCIKSGARMLAASLVFIESFRIAAMMDQIQALTIEMSADERRDTIFEVAGENARMIWESHSRGRGEANFQVRGTGGSPPSGCATVIVLGIGTGLFVFLLIA